MVSGAGATMACRVMHEPQSAPCTHPRPGVLQGIGPMGESPPLDRTVIVHFGLEKGGASTAARKSRDASLTAYSTLEQRALGWPFVYMLPPRTEYSRYQTGDFPRGVTGIPNGGDPWLFTTAVARLRAAQTRMTVGESRQK